ncbi:MAG: hypothetical protein WBA05_14165 [Gordonia sp. (in: high G+C Gram-positive bacteria)]|uniref:hypothetical protein n=1 Tax=Gordonia TaxID=2053 RepID=UPI003267C41E
MLSRLAMASALYYVIAVLYHGTVGSSGFDVLVQPMVGTAVFAGIIFLPLAAGWLLMRTVADAGDA